MAKLHLTGNKLSSDELNRMLCTDTIEAVSMDAGVEHEDVSATNILDETNRSATTNERSATTSEATETCSATTSDRSDTTKTESQRVNQWKKENRDTLRIDLPKGMKAEIQAEAKKRGCSVTTLIQ